MRGFVTSLLAVGLAVTPVMARASGPGDNDKDTPKTATADKSSDSKSTTTAPATPGTTVAESEMQQIREMLAAQTSILYAAHAEIAACFPDKTERLEWAPARPMAARRSGRTVLLPASALARKGAYALREAIAGLDLDLVISGEAVEGENFWNGLPARRLRAGENIFEIAAVVLPAIVEHQPRALLGALAAGIPVIATPACGLAPRDGLTLAPPMDASALRAALVACLEKQI